MSSQKKSSRLEGKDLITIGIYTVIYVVIVMLVAMLGFIPIFIPLMAVLCPLIGGIPYMLYVTKAKKFGMTAIMGFLIGLIMVFFGNGYLTMVTGLVGGLLADVILKKADYKSAKSTVLSCGVFSIWVFGNFAPIFLNRESYMVMLTEGYGAEYAATLNTYMPMWIAPILLVACFVFGLVVVVHHHLGVTDRNLDGTCLGAALVAVVADHADFLHQRLAQLEVDQIGIADLCFMCHKNILSLIQC